VPEDYVHRIGRTGRAGAQGEAVSLVCVDEDGFLRDIEKLIKREIPKEIVPGFAPPSTERPEPIVLGRMVIGEGAGRGGNRHHAPARGGQGAPRGNGGGRGGDGRGDRPRSSDSRPAAPAARPQGSHAPKAAAPVHGGHRPAGAPTAARPDSSRGPKPGSRLTQPKPR